MSDFHGHGWDLIGRDGSEIAGLQVGELPGRKQICLYGHNGNASVLHVYAFFPTQEKAQEALTIFDRLMKR